MDIETTKKINELAKNLRTKGLAASSEEASALSEKMLLKELPKEGSVKGKNYEEVEILLERIQRKVNNELAALKEQISSLSNQLDMIRGDLSKIRKSNIVEPKKEEKQEKLSEEKKEETKKDNQRIGGFKPGDIDINKIFYCGEK